MTIARFEDRVPSIGAGTYVHPSADVLGDVRIGERCWIGPGARIRGDYGRIVIGSCTSIEDNCVVHARPDEQTTIGDRVTVGHAAIIHNATVRDHAVLGMGCIVSDWADVGVWAVVAEGALVKQRFVVPDSRIAVGVPAHILEKEVGADYKEQWSRFKQVYVDLARRYPQGLAPLV